MTVTFRREGDAGLVELANPPVNAMGLAVRQGLMSFHERRERAWSFTRDRLR